MTGGYIGAVSIEGGGLRMPSMVVFCDVKGVRDTDQSKLAPKSSVAAYKPQIAKPAAAARCCEKGESKAL